MSNVFGSIALQIAWAILEPLILTGVASLVAWATMRWHQWTGYQIDAKNREALQSALENGVRAALVALRAQKGYLAITNETRGQVLDFAQAYVESSVPGAVKHFKLTPDKIQELAVPHLPLDAPMPLARRK